MPYPRRKAYVKKDKKVQHRVIGPFMIAMITIAAVDSIRNLPVMAVYGLSIILILVLVAIFFFIPLGLVTAELSSAWPERGGVYIWTKEAFGERWGIFSAWVQWAHNVPWYPSVLTYIAATFAYAINPSWAKNKWYVLAVVLVLLWGLTFINFLGMKVSGWLSTVGVIIGTIIPGAFLISLGFAWLAMGEPLGLSTVHMSWVPHLHIPDLVFIAGVLFGFVGLELSATHAKEVVNPQKSYPMGFLISVIVIIVLSVLGALAIAVSVPHSQLNIVTGIMDTFSYILNTFHLHFLVYVLAIAIGLGAVASVSTWLYGSLKAILTIAVNDQLPKRLSKVNKHRAPTTLLFLQAIIGTIFSLVFILMPSVQSAYWILSDMATQSYLIMYAFLFVAAIVLRYKKPNKERPFKIPLGNFGMMLSCILGLIACASVFCIGFIEPAQIKSIGQIAFDVILIVGLVILVAPPLILYQFYGRKR